MDGVCGILKGQVVIILFIIELQVIHGAESTIYIESDIFRWNGFKWRGQSNDTNGDGDNYVYM